MKPNIFKAIGLMSGTSMDGIDAAIIKTDGYKLLQTGASQFFPYSHEFREKIRNIINGHGNIAEFTKELTILHAGAVKALIAASGEDKNSFDLIGFHGHTTYHNPEKLITVQLGDGPLLSAITGILVVNDFRSNDVKSGGQGAPLVPIFHYALMAAEQKPIAVVNIGGVANVTWVGETEAELLAFDTGPGNALIDDFTRTHTGQNFDINGQLASTGKIDQELLNNLLSNEYFLKKPPKSLDRNQFATISENYEISAADGAATLVAFTCSAIANSAQHFPKKVKKWLIAGGGRHNKAIMDYLKNHIKEPVMDINMLGIDGDMLEAQAFAFLAVRTKLGLPISFPGTTGVKEPLVGGVQNYPI